MRITFDFVPEDQCETDRTLIQYSPNGDTVVVVNQGWYDSLSHDQKKVLLFHEYQHAKTYARVSSRWNRAADHAVNGDLFDEPHPVLVACAKAHPVGLVTDYVVLYRPEGSKPLDAPCGWRCHAENTDDAEEQFENLGINAEIIWTVETNDYQQALKAWLAGE